MVVTGHSMIHWTPRNACPRHKIICSALVYSALLLVPVRCIECVVWLAYDVHKQFALYCTQLKLEL